MRPKKASRFVADTVESPTDVATQFLGNRTAPGPVQPVVHGTKLLRAPTVGLVVRGVINAYVGTATQDGGALGTDYSVSRPGLTFGSTRTPRKKRAGQVTLNVRHFLRSINMKSLEGFEESFIGHAVRNNAGYGFLPHFRYFMENKHRWANATAVVNRILKPVPEAPNEAWEVWRQFRSAQAEITSIFLFENYFHGQVEDIEVSRPGSIKPCDIRARLPSCGELYVEVKAQSGQQHG